MSGSGSVDLDNKRLGMWSSEFKTLLASYHHLHKVQHMSDIENPNAGNDKRVDKGKKKRSNSEELRAEAEERTLQIIAEVEALNVDAEMAKERPPGGTS